MYRSTLALLACLTITACATRPPALPSEHAWRLPWGAVDPANGQTVGVDQSVRQMGQGTLPPDTDGDGRANYALLVISGGGAKGAFGAGVLSGWSQTGSRPAFTIVTGVSTGALMATWAFLGPAHDPALEDFYTRVTDEQVFQRKSLLTMAFGASVLDTSPLRETIASAVDGPLLDAVAREYQKGRRLYVASTDLDSNRLVVWDLGAIAASGHPDRLERYRDALLASAAIPVGFPPVYFPVEVAGREYGQMHVDGGAVANFFLTGFVIDRQKALAPQPFSASDVNVDLYLLMNSQLTPQPPTQAIKPDLMSIAAASSWATAWSAQTHQLVRTYRAARGIGIDFHLAGIPDDYGGALPIASFDPAQMEPLFRFAERHAQGKDFWLDAPPGIDHRERAGE